MKRILGVLLLVLSVLQAKVAVAVCPICTVAVAAGVGFSRWLGVDDSLSGLWVGGLTMSVSAWTVNWFEAKKWHFYRRDAVIYIAYFALVVLPLYFMHFIGKPLSVFANLGIDKLTLGIIVGSVVFWTSNIWYEELKRTNNDKAYFPYQKVVMPVGALLIISIIFYFISK